MASRRHLALMVASWLAASIVAVPLLWPATAAANDQELVQAAHARCEAHLLDLRGSAGRRHLIAAILAAVGGLGAAASGLRAGVSDPNKGGKKWGIVAVVAGLAAAAAPHTPVPPM